MFVYSITISNVKKGVKIFKAINLSLYKSYATSHCSEEHFVKLYINIIFPALTTSVCMCEWFLITHTRYSANKK